MSYTPLINLLPEVGYKETRTATVGPGNRYQLPADSYGFVELYCEDKGCDCRRVFFLVVTEKTQKEVATVTFGWESKDFYARWYTHNKKATYAKLSKEDRLMVDSLYGVHLNPMSPQSKIANQVLALVEDCIISDEDYCNRLKRHYKLFRAKVDEKHRKNK